MGGVHRASTRREAPAQPAAAPSWPGREAGAGLAVPWNRSPGLLPERPRPKHHPPGRERFRVAEAGSAAAGSGGDMVGRGGDGDGSGDDTGVAARSDPSFPPRSGSASAETWTVLTGSWPRSAPWPKSLSARLSPPCPPPCPGHSAHPPFVIPPRSPQSSVKLKLICAQVLRDLLGEAMEVSGTPPPPCCPCVIISNITDFHTLNTSLSSNNATSQPSQ